MTSPSRFRWLYVWQVLSCAISLQFLIPFSLFSWMDDVSCSPWIWCAIGLERHITHRAQKEHRQTLIHNIFRGCQLHSIWASDETAYSLPYECRSTHGIDSMGGNWLLYHTAGSDMCHSNMPREPWRHSREYLKWGWGSFAPLIGVGPRGGLGVL